MDRVFGKLIIISKGRESIKDNLKMNKRKIVGIVVVIFGVVMVGGSLGYQGSYRAMAPISMSLIVIVGLLMIFWDKFKGWIKTS